MNLKDTLRRSAERALSAMSPACLLRLARVDFLSVFYHTVWDERPIYFRGNYRVRTAAEFVGEIDELLKCFQPVSLADLIASGRGGPRLPPSAAFLSFDDGYRQLAEIVAPILLRKGVPATFFLTRNPIDHRDWCFEDEIGLLLAELHKLSSGERDECVSRCLVPAGFDLETLRRTRRRPDAAVDALWDWFKLDRGACLNELRPYLTGEQVRGMIRDGFGIGAHGIDHALLSDLPLEDQLQQVRTSVEWLTETFGVADRAFAFPYGEFGISSEFFKMAMDQDLADLFVGTRGVIADEWHPRVRHRFWCESETVGLERPLRRHLGGAALRGLRGRNLVRRTCQG